MPLDGKRYGFRLWTADITVRIECWMKCWDGTQWLTSWWFQPIWKIWLFSPVRVKIKNLWNHQLGEFKIWLAKFHAAMTVLIICGATTLHDQAISSWQHLMIQTNFNIKSLRVEFSLKDIPKKIKSLGPQYSSTSQARVSKAPLEGIL